jgi:S-sulfo-L-cysteine synthase (O-acetyl-L-serine-dependent)
VELRGVLRPGATLIEATGGNTGIAFVFAAAIRGYRLMKTIVVLLPDTGVRYITTALFRSDK